MTKEKITAKIIDIFCKECQSVWVVDVNDQSMTVYSDDVKKSIPNSVDIVKAFNSYEKARLWYIDNCIIDSQRSSLLRQTELKHVLEMTANGEAYYIEYSRIMNGEINYNQLCYDRINDDDGSTVYLILGFRNIDVRKRTEIDDVTGLLTRQAFFQKAEDLLNSNPNVQFDIVISDIMDFKKVNETYGVEMADTILRWTGKFLSQYMSDALLIGRYGGDQMVMMGSHEDMVAYTTQKREADYLTLEKRNGLPNVITKFGIYENISHDASIVSSCDKAHLALNSIKRQYDKTFAYYDDTFKNELDKQRRIENSMHESLENGDFKVYYQPKHDAETGKLIGAEALIRWIHPVYGFMSPADFIPLFEKNGFVAENDRFVWTKTCENIRKWEDKGIKTVPISVNASKITLSKDKLFEYMQVPVAKYNISPKQLHIEITETLMTDDVDNLIDKLSRLREMGYQIELDDFGSGYSSINVLSMLPLDVVKLDMSFMQQFGDRKRTKVLDACINLAKELGYKTVSEGVEEHEQYNLLKDIGVDIIQGFLYSRPLTEDEFEQYLVKNMA